MTDRRRLSRTFDAAAATYHQARPEYPDELYRDLVSACRLGPGARLLEIGAATGKATLPLARRGFRLTCVEQGAELSATAAARLAEYSNVEVFHAAFEDWVPRHQTPFDLVFAATAWHWIDPAVRYEKAWALLRPQGHLAFWAATHVLPDGGDAFFREIQDVYDEIGKGLPPGHRWPCPGELQNRVTEVESSGRFDVITVQEYVWEVMYDAMSYIALLETFSDHISMEPWQKSRLYGEIRRRLGQRPDGMLRRHWGTLLHIARRRD